MDGVTVAKKKRNLFHSSHCTGFNATYGTQTVANRWKDAIFEVPLLKQCLHLTTIWLTFNHTVEWGEHINISLRLASTERNSYEIETPLVCVCERQLHSDITFSKRRFYVFNHILCDPCNVYFRTFSRLLFNSFNTAFFFVCLAHNKHSQSLINLSNYHHIL